MKKYINSFVILVVFILLSRCTPKASEKTDILLNKDLIPEGVAYNTNSKSIYVGAIYKQKIIEIQSDGTYKDLITKEVFGDLSPIGIEFVEKSHDLWINLALAPIVNQTNQDRWETGLMRYNVRTNEKEHYIVKDSLRSFFNDLTVLPNDDVIITETANARLFKFDAAKKELEPYIELTNFSFPNGITFYQPKQLLFVSTNEGIVKIDIQTKEQSLLKVAPNINAKVIDGLSFYKNYFIGHQSTKISKFYVNDEFTEITNVEVFDTGKEFDSSTTGEIGSDKYHYIVNSQIKSGIENKKIKPLDSLENVIIRSKPL